MADAALDMPLDDLVVRKSRGGPRGRKRGGAGAGSAGPARRNNMRRAAATRGTPYTRGNPDGQWKHDMYNSPAGGRRAGGSTGGTGKIMISNLDPAMIKDSDLKELFGNIGRIKSARCLYDKAGRNLGEAEVEFFRAEDAEAARRKYDNVQLDGRNMKIHIVGGAAPRVNVMDRITATGQRQRVAPARGGGRGGMQRGGRGGGRGRGRGGRGPPKTQEELDKELDQYMDTTEDS